MISLTNCPSCVLVLFVTAQPLTADPIPCPDPHQDQAAAAFPARTTRLRRVLGKLITHGKRLAEDLSRRPSSITVCWIAVRFGTKDLALILARITRGLRMAAALKATLPEEREHPCSPRPACSAPAARKPRTRPTPLPAKNADAVLANLPTSKQIAAQLRDRSIGDVLAEICHDLGILTADPFWQELEIALLENGGNFESVVEDSEKRIAFSHENFFPPDMWGRPPANPPPSAARPADTAVTATGPP